MIRTPFVLRGAAANPRGSREMDFWPDATIAVDEKGIIRYAGKAAALPEQWQPVAQQRVGGVLFPGFIDAHVHLPQLDCRGRFGTSLLNWLHDFIYPAESLFEDDAVARDVARRFFQALTDAGTSTAMVFCTSHSRATDIAFEEAEASGLRVIMGNTLMDRGAPEQLCVPAMQAMIETERLIERWHRATPLLHFAVSPRFAPACSSELLRQAGVLAAKYDLHIQTHFNESLQEITSVRAIFPQTAHYAAVYHEAGILASKTVLGHSVHTSDSEMTLLAESGTAVAHCPDSNLFLGSGRFPLELHEQYGIRVALASDVGAGTTLNMLSVMRSMCHVQGRSLHPLLPLFLATLGGAQALNLQDETGSLTPGKSADIIVIPFPGNSLDSSELRSLTAVDLASTLVYTTSCERVLRHWVGGRELPVTAATSTRQ
ncbi:MAG: guanine deaminase [Bacteroidia bacterium]|nr:guanine deaminase [Bacteroidia bacterium]